jgi:serine/threonine protein phosphatase PrpC
MTAAGSAAEAGGPYPCPSCGEQVWPGDNFCEACRADLAPAHVSGARPPAVEGGSGPGGTAGGSSGARAARCPSCPDAGVTSDGYCESCGRKVPIGADHAEIQLDVVAGVTDRGLRHYRNEDAMALASASAPDGPAAIAVVCDGVSTSSRPDEAAHAAAQAAVDVLLMAVRLGDDLAAASVQAFSAAQKSLFELAAQDQVSDNAPSATYVSAVVSGTDVIVCWLGDSRAYWLDARAGSDADTRQLTSDDSVAHELVARGLLTDAEALASPAGHIVTGWIGADLREAKPHVCSYSPGGPGVVLLCSDGLWNYQPDATALAARVLPAGLTDPLGTAAALVRFAVESGGSDNITAVLVPFPLGSGHHQPDPGEPAHEPE